ncbi:MAG TPA: methyltransferase domain-containing protein [Jiangellaceae bacterium]
MRTPHCLSRAHSLAIAHDVLGEGCLEFVAAGVAQFLVDVGCGGGASTILMAQAYPASTFVGFDSREPSIAMANEAAAEAGVSPR